MSFIAANLLEPPFEILIFFPQISNGSCYSLIVSQFNIIENLYNIFLKKNDSSQADGQTIKIMNLNAFLNSFISIIIFI